MTSDELINLWIMDFHAIQCGYLKVRAVEMIKPLNAAQIRGHYDLDDKGYMKLSMNALLVVNENQLVLIDPGCADFLHSRLMEDYGLEIPVAIEEQLAGVGYHPGEITDVVFTHLHFDHGSGAFVRVPGNIEKRFPKAKYHVLKEHFEYAENPDQKESNSFFTSFLTRIDKVHWLEEWDNDLIEFKVFNGHTKGMVVPHLKARDMDTYYLSDLMPLELFLNPEVYSGYDINSGLVIEEKKKFLADITKSSRFLFYHDPLKYSEFYP